MKKHSQFKRKTSLLSTSRICGALLGALITSASFGQGVGINTTTPDPSAALDIQSSDKGILVPRVSLQNPVDNTTVPNPANGLLVYNTNVNAFSTGAGFYYNTGTPSIPNWTSLSEPKLPFIKGGSSTGSLFWIENGNANSDDNSAIRASSIKGYALKTEGKIKISGAGQQPGSGKVLTSDGSGNATWQGGVAFSVHGIKTGGPEVLAKDILYKVPFHIEQYDSNNSHKIYPENTFTAPTSGIYHFDIKVLFFLASNTARVDIRKIENGSESVLISEDAKGRYFDSIDFNLNAGDIIFVTIYNSGDENMELVSLGSHFNGHFVKSSL